MQSLAKLDQDLILITNELSQNPESEMLKNIKAAHLNNKALILGQLQKFNDAIKCINQAIDLNPTNNYLSLLLNKASFYHKISKFNESLEWAHKVLEMDSNNEKAVEIIILNLSSQVALDNEKGNNMEALNKLERAIELKPNDASLLFNKAAILHEIEEYDRNLLKNITIFMKKSYCGNK